MKSITLAVIICMIVLANSALADNVRGIDIEFVTIGNPGNAADTGGTPGCGAVGYMYRIGKYEVTNSQWKAFVSAAGAPIGNPSNGYDDISHWTRDQQPIDYISWYEAAQFCNYLTSGDKSKGVYIFSGNNSNPGNFLGIDRATAKATYGMIYFLPTEDEWYKAAYFKPDGSGYSFFANGTNTAPIAGVESNYYSIYTIGPWDVGSGSQEQNGTFDMMGNDWEWLETFASSEPKMRGGMYVHWFDTYLRSSGCWSYFPADEDGGLSFRVASLPPPPPPSGDGICNVYGVFVGVKDYFEKKSFTLMRGDLDAQLMYDIFKNRFSNFKEGKVLLADTTSNPPVNVTIDDVNEAINSFNMDSDDILIFYESSHGAWYGTDDETTLTEGDECIVTGYGVYIGDDDLTELLKNVPCQKWVFLSACYSGGFWGNDQEKNGRDLDFLSNIGFMAATPENKVSYFCLGRSIFTQALITGLSYDLFPHLAADYNWNGIISWDELTTFMKYDPHALINPGTVVHEGAQGDPVIWSNDMWEPVVITSSDFVPLPLDVVIENSNTLTIQNFVKQFQKDLNRPYINQGFLTYIEKTGNLNGIDPNDIFYTAPDSNSSKIVSLIPVKNVQNQIIDFNELSLDARPFVQIPNDPNSDVLLALSIYCPEPNDPNIISENYLKFGFAPNAFKGKTITIQQVSSELNVNYPVWDIRNIISKNNGKLPLDSIISCDVDPNVLLDPNCILNPNIPVKAIEPNVLYSWFTLSTNRQVADIDDNGTIDYNDYLILLSDLGKKGVLRSDIASLKYSLIVLGIPDGKVDESDISAFILEYNKIYPNVPLPYFEGFEGFESGSLGSEWKTYGDAPWVVDSNNPSSGNYSVHSGAIGDYQSSILKVTSNCTMGKISFKKKVSSEQNFDFLTFYIDGVYKGEWSGEQDWSSVSYTTTPGTHTFKWEYTKDRGSAYGEDAAWIDDIDIQ
jgi:formylglycine-generating enzyme